MHCIVWMVIFISSHKIMIAKLVFMEMPPLKIQEKNVGKRNLESIFSVPNVV